jgi:UDP-N-acetylmuramoylalanine--D-glutamate ligase
LAFSFISEVDDRSAANTVDLLKEKKIAIMGIARSGVALARVLSGLGASIFLSDSKPAEDLGEWLGEIEGIPCSIETGGNTDALWQGRDMIVISPGVPIRHPLLEKARAAGVPVMAEVEIAYLLAKAPIIAVTGTNGKSTTTKLISQILTADGRKSLFAGNIGIPLVEEVSKIPPDGFIVSEISSFQLEGIHAFRPLVALCLNITIDHQDRHASFEEYRMAKARLFMNQTQNEIAVLNADDDPTVTLREGIQSRILYFSRRKRVCPGVFFRDGLIVRSEMEGPDTALFPWKEGALRGLHNLENLLAATAATLALGVSPESIVRAVESFEPLHHRMELVRVIGGVSYVDDSKGTNPGAVIAALDGGTAPVILIAGGSDKGTDFAALGEAIARHAKALVVIGKTADKIAGAARAAGFHSLHRAESLREAVEKAASLASPGDSVLLSPACASFDMFNNAEHRGDMFKEIVTSL